MKQYIIVIILALCLVSCSHHSKHWETLAQVESYIEERPDSALTVLQGMDKGELSGMEEKAKHALLLSMAMDKNYIDRTDFDVLQPAIDYYEDNGSATDKLRTYYYQGRIYQNAGNNAAAMECFVNAISEGDDSGDILTKARILYTQGLIYSTIFEWDKCIVAYSNAANYFKQNGRIDSYVNCISSIINVYTIVGDNEKAEHYISLGLSCLEECSIRIKAYFYSNHITYLASKTQRKVEEIKSIINQYTTHVPYHFVDWLSISNAYLNIGEVDLAMDAIKKHKVNINKEQQARYYALLADIHKRKKNHEEAMNVYLKYVHLTDSLDQIKNQQGLRFIQDRHTLEMQVANEKGAKNQRTAIILGCIIALLAVLLLLNSIRKRLKKAYFDNTQLEIEKKRYEQMYLEILSERDALNNMVTNSSIQAETITVIRQRLEILNSIVISHLSDRESDIKRANEQLEKLVSDRESFIKSTRLTLEGNYPNFFAYLLSKGLEEHEIDFCCLYAIGMKGKEVKAYTSNRHYKDSSEVRQKLGLTEQDTNLSIFLQKLLKNQQG